MALTTLALDRLLAPIDTLRPGGVDISYEEDHAAIREARRADDPSLAQGEWGRALKQADWARVRSLAESTLATRSKDLQVAMWLVEALGRLDGFAGLADGFALLRGLFADFWDTLHPSLDEGLEPRIARIEWLRATLPAVIGAVPLVGRDAGGFGLARHEEALAVENLGRREPAAMQAAIAAGRLTPEAWARAVGVTTTAFYTPLAAALAAARAELARFGAEIERRLGADAPSLDAIGEPLARCAALVGRILKDRGREDPAESAVAAVGAAASPASPPATAGAIVSREDALQRLNEVALWFRRSEPHSPVAFLCEKAGDWAQMPFEAWLAAVIKDPGSLAHVRELLGIRIAE